MYYVSKHAFLRLGQKWGQPLFLGVGKNKKINNPRFTPTPVIIEWN
jgi:hypothetical protein